MLLCWTCKPIGRRWSGRDNRSRRRRKSRGGSGRPAPLYLGASGTFSSTWGTWWAKSAVRYPQSLKFNLFWSLFLPPTHTNRIEEVTLKSDEKLFFFLLQMSYKNSSWTKPTFPTTPPNPQTRSKTVWDSRVEGYIVLRDLDLYLTKLARDFLFLASKTYWKEEKKNGTQHTHRRTPELTINN